MPGTPFSLSLPDLDKNVNIFICSTEIVKKTISISTKIVIRYAVKWGISFLVHKKVNGNWAT